MLAIHFSLNSVFTQDAIGFTATAAPPNSIGERTINQCFLGAWLRSPDHLEWLLLRYRVR